MHGFKKTSYLSCMPRIHISQPNDGKAFVSMFPSFENSTEKTTALRAKEEEVRAKNKK
jgi:deoxyxylulose-5-phosphate synthase